MNPNFVLRTGKHAGKTISWVQDNDAGYLAWMRRDRPEMLKGSEDKPKVEPKAVAVEAVQSSMVPNLNFWNEGPDPMSIPYLKKMEEAKKNLDFPF